MALEFVYERLDDGFGSGTRKITGEHLNQVHHSSLPRSSSRFPRFSMEAAATCHLIDMSPHLTGWYNTFIAYQPQAVCFRVGKAGGIRGRSLITSETVKTQFSPMVELPTVEEILEVKSIHTAFQEAWEKSFIDKAHCCEQGGYIYAGAPSNLLVFLVQQLTTSFRSKWW